MSSRIIYKKKRPNWFALFRLRRRKWWRIPQRSVPGSPRSFQNSSSRELRLKTQPPPQRTIATPTYPNHALTSPAVFLCDVRPANFTHYTPVSSPTRDEIFTLPTRTEFNRFGPHITNFSTILSQSRTFSPRNRITS